ncbi:MAG: alpha-methylacyl-CoA racemase, partial [Pseudohongiellaceae bacterium]
NVIDGAAPFYNVYQCADKKWISLACIEAQFYQAFIDASELNEAEFSDQWQRNTWTTRIKTLKQMILKKPRNAWIKYFEDHEVCIVPVLNMKEAQAHPHNIARQSFQTIDKISQASAMPKMSATPPATRFGVHRKNADQKQILSRWTIDQDCS